MTSFERESRWIRGLAAAALALGLAWTAACKKEEPPKPQPKPAAAKPKPPEPPKADAPAVEASTPPAPKPPVPEDYYKASRLRDPFIDIAAGGGAVQTVSEVVVSTENFSVQNLDLKGILDTPRGRIALLVDPLTSASYVLRGGKVIGAKGEPIPGVKGEVRGQSVLLKTGDGESQELFLGDEEEE